MVLDNTPLGRVRPDTSRGEETTPLGRGKETATPVHPLSPKGWHRVRGTRVAYDCRGTSARGRELLKTPGRTSTSSPRSPARSPAQFLVQPVCREPPAADGTRCFAGENASSLRLERGKPFYLASQRASSAWARCACFWEGSLNLSRGAVFSPRQIFNCFPKVGI